MASSCGERAAAAPSPSPLPSSPSPQRQDEQRMRVRRLKGHSDSLLCCVSHPSTPRLVATSGEDGMMCIFDLRSKEEPQKYERFGEAVMSLCYHQGNENHIFAAAGKTIDLIDIRLGPGGNELCKFQFNTDDINQIAINQNGTFVAAADDNGETKDSKLGLFARQAYQKALIPGNSSHDLAGICNPPFVHALAVSERDVQGGSGRALAVARGDGVVDIYNVELDRSKSSPKKGPTRSRQKIEDNSHSNSSDNNAAHGPPGRRCQLGLGNSGHSSAVSHVSFSKFGEDAGLLISGGNDASLKLWDWSYCYTTISEQEDFSPLRLSLSHGEKINYISTISSSSENLLIADTSTHLSLYTII